ncbi:MAG TPA: hypothetical protein VMD98_02025 [Bryocella sp.]|nr:hypothetical protein [Bryocella sp.]
MRRLSCFLLLIPVLMISGCGSGTSNTGTVNGLFGDWNITMFPTGSSSAMYVFALAISQEGTDNYSGSPITYDGTVPVPSNLCINSSALHATATTNGSNFTMTVSDSTSETIITMTGSLSTFNDTLSGTYTNPASETCPASSGSFSMTLQPS